MPRETPPTGLRAAWLVNQYPKVSHSFITREIAALEARGLQIDRIAIRGTPEGEGGAALAGEAARTHRVLEQGGARLLADTLRVALAGPGRFAGALRVAWSMGRRSPRGVLVHLIYLAEAAHVARRCKQRGLTHIHAHFGTNPAAVARLAGRLSGIPYSMTVHGPEEFDAPQALSLGDKAAEAAFTVAISRYGRSQLCRWTDAAHWDRLHVVRCGLDLAAFDAAADADPGPPEAPHLVCVGRLSEQKGHLTVIEAAATVAKAVPGFRLTLVGDGELRATIEARIAALGLGDAVTITGWADESGVRDAILNARALVLGSFAEGLPVVLMEALALRRPVVTTWVAGIPELVDETCGWTVPPGDAEALARAMIAALGATPDTLAAMGQAGRVRVEAMHSLAREAARLHALVDRAGT